MDGDQIGDLDKIDEEIEAELRKRKKKKKRDLPKDFSSWDEDAKIAYQKKRAAKK